MLCDHQGPRVSLVASGQCEVEVSGEESLDTANILIDFLCLHVNNDLQG